MTGDEMALAIEFLKDLADKYGNAGCNDWRWPKDWSSKQRHKWAWRYANHPDVAAGADAGYFAERLTASEFGPPDFMMVGLLIDVLNEMETA